MFYVTYILAFSPLMVCMSSCSELWLESIPPQASESMGAFLFFQAWSEEDPASQEAFGLKYHAAWKLRRGPEGGKEKSGPIQNACAQYTRVYLAVFPNHTTQNTHVFGWTVISLSLSFRRPACMLHTGTKLLETSAERTLRECTAEVSVDGFSQREIPFNSHRHTPCHDEQLMTPGGALAKVKKMAVEQNLLVWGGYAGMGGMSLLTLSAIHFGVETILTTIHLIMLGGCVSMVSARTRCDMGRLLLNLNSLPTVVVFFTHETSCLTTP